MRPDLGPEVTREVIVCSWVKTSLGSKVRSCLTGGKSSSGVKSFVLTDDGVVALSLELDGAAEPCSALA